MVVVAPICLAESRGVHRCQPLLPQGSDKAVFPFIFFTVVVFASTSGAVFSGECQCFYFFIFFIAGNVSKTNFQVHRFAFCVQGSRVKTAREEQARRRENRDDRMQHAFSSLSILCKLRCKQRPSKAGEGSIGRQATATRGETTQRGASVLVQQTERHRGPVK